MHYIIFAWFLASLPPEGDAALQRLLMRFSEQTHFQAQFTETKKISFLSTPLISHGTMEFQAPDRLVKTIETPDPSTMRVQGSQITIINNQETQHVDLKQYPHMLQFVSGMLALLRGDASLLLADYDAKSTFKKSQWHIILTPKPSSSSTVVKKLAFEGIETKPKRMTLTEKNGDVTVTQFIYPKKLEQIKK